MVASNLPQLPTLVVPRVGVPLGDLGAQLITDLTLIVVACEFDTLSNVMEYVQRAHATAVEMANHVTCRHSGPSTFVRLTFCSHADIDPVFLPVLDGVLVLPGFNLDDLAQRNFPQQSIEIVEFELVHCMVRLRLRKLAGLLKELGVASSRADIGTVMRTVLSECLRIKSSNDLMGLAVDYFSLARGLIGSRNFPFAVLALHKAENTLVSLSKEPKRNRALRRNSSYEAADNEHHC